jgi:cytochrome c peroxidase
VTAGRHRRAALLGAALATASVGLAAACQLSSTRLPEPPRLDPDFVQRGGVLFLDPRVSGDGSRSCASCHEGGGTNGKVYAGADEVAPASEGGRNVPALYGAWQTPPYLWDGSVETVREAVELMLRVQMRGASLSEPDLRALVSYVQSLRPFDRGRTSADGAPLDPAPLGARRGFEVFQASGCADCHVPPSLASRRSADVGTGTRINVPTLRGLSETAPYGHDGRWASLEEAVRASLAAQEVELSVQELEQLLQYLSLL